MRLRLLSFTALGAIVLLAGCARLSLLPGVDIGVNLAPPMLTYTVPNTVTFTSRPGSVGATITGYRIDFYDASGNPLIADGSSISGVLNVLVPAGLQCATPDVSCSINDPGARFAARTAEPISVFLAPPQQPTGSAQAEIRFFGTDDNRREFNLDPVRVPIVRR